MSICWSGGLLILLSRSDHGLILGICGIDPWILSVLRPSSLVICGLVWVSDPVILIYAWGFDHFILQPIPMDLPVLSGWRFQSSFWFLEMGLIKSIIFFLLLFVLLLHSCSMTPPLNRSYQ